MSKHLKSAENCAKRTKHYLQLALWEKEGDTATAIIQLLEQSARLLQDLDALQSAVKADNKEKQ